MTCRWQIYSCAKNPRSPNGHVANLWSTELELRNEGNHPLRIVRYMLERKHLAPVSISSATPSRSRHVPDP
jgi:hypothetical protein